MLQGGHLTPFEDKTERFCYEDFLKWSDDERWEIIDGRVYDMTPAPSFKLQRIVGNTHHLIAPRSATDVVLPEHSDRHYFVAT
jgi:hypothetical protein